MKKLSISTVLALIIFYGCEKTNREEQKTSVQITIISPVNGGSFSPLAEPEFVWKSVSSNATDPISYKIKIVEIKGNESPDEALRTNKPHFEKDSLKEQSYVYPRTAVKFASGATYGWQITAKQKGGTTVGDNSSAVTFKMK